MYSQQQRYRQVQSAKNMYTRFYCLNLKLWVHVLGNSTLSISLMVIMYHVASSGKNPGSIAVANQIRSNHIKIFYCFCGFPLHFVGVIGSAHDILMRHSPL